MAFSYTRRARKVMTGERNESSFLLFQEGAQWYKVSIKKWRYPPGESVHYWHSPTYPTIGGVVEVHVSMCPRDEDVVPCRTVVRFRVALVRLSSRSHFTQLHPVEGSSGSSFSSSSSEWSWFPVGWWGPSGWSRQHLLGQHGMPSSLWCDGSKGQCQQL